MVEKVSLKQVIGTEEEIDFLKAIEKFNCQDNGFVFLQKSGEYLQMIKHL